MRCSISHAVEIGIPDCLQLFNVMVTSKSVLKEVLRVCFVFFLMLNKEENVNASAWYYRFTGSGFQMQYLMRSVMMYFLTPV